MLARIATGLILLGLITYGLLVPRDEARIERESFARSLNVAVTEGGYPEAAARAEWARRYPGEALATVLAR